MIDWNDAFDNSSYVPGSDKFADEWSQAASAFRASQGSRAQIDVAYGTQAREKLDLFSPEGKAKGTVIFVHGGYWHMLDKSFFSHLAAGCLSQGWRVVIPSYPLAPDTRISDITKSVARAVTWVSENTAGPLALIGHSAGGHLVARMACDGMLPPTITKRLQRVVAVSGLHHLQPLTMTRMNDILGLTEDEAIAESPITHQPLTDVPITFWVGANERPELLRQTRIAVKQWGQKGAMVTAQYEPDQDHFSVIGSLADPQGALVKELMS